MWLTTTKKQNEEKTAATPWRHRTALKDDVESRMISTETWILFDESKIRNKDYYNFVREVENTY